MIRYEEAGVHCVVMVYVLSGFGADVRGDSVGNG